jgi:hypothetical protein
MKTNMTNIAWTCQRCGGGFISTPPELGLCDQCLRDLETLARASQPPGPTCMECGGPVCPDCGEAVPLVIAVSALPLVLTPLEIPRREVNGDGG